MILPKKHTDPKKKYISAGTTFVFCLLGYLLMAYMDVPEQDTSRMYVREISQLNITRIMPEPEPEIQEEPEMADEAEDSPAEEEPEASPESPRRINMDEVLPEGIRVDLSTQRTEREPARQQRETTQQRSLRIDESEMEQMGGLQTLSERSLTSRRADRRTAGDAGDETGGITAAEGGGLTGERGGIGGDRGARLAGPRGRDGDGAGVEVGLRDLDEFGEDYSTINYNALVEWMKENPADLPVPVRRLMRDGRWDPSFLTSRIPFYIDERQFDLLLMVIEERLEVHILLVENLDATYLIDYGLRGQSSYLRVGGVGYQDQDIADVDSQMRNASRDQTEEFYAIFLSWFETIKEEYD
jgi:hypothetical protein